MLEMLVSRRFAGCHFLLSIAFLEIPGVSSEVNRDVIVEPPVIMDLGQFNYGVKPVVDDTTILRVVNRNGAKLHIPRNCNSIPREPDLRAPQRVRFPGGLSAGQRSGVNRYKADRKRFHKVTLPG